MAIRTPKLSRAEYEGLLADQGGVCAICLQSPKNDFELAPHRCRTTGDINALLCIPCKLILGNAQYDQARLARAIDYLKDLLGEERSPSELLRLHFPRAGGIRTSADEINRLAGFHASRRPI